LKNPGIGDFRDPNVSWYKAGKKWIMTLATLDRVTFYSSKDMKNWVKESEFGKEAGAHGGVWECPDLFPLDYNGQSIWVLLVSINPGGPNGGSATQYFTGQFDGKTFIPYQTDTRWIDYGPDDYAGVTWFNTGNRKVFLGWMSNWQYANVVPSRKWRGANTVPRELGIKKVDDKYMVTSEPINELNTLNEDSVVLNNIEVNQTDLIAKAGKLTGPARLSLSSDKIESFSITFSNDSGEKVIAGYDKGSNNFFIDRTKSGKVEFEKGFAAKHIAPRLSKNEKFDLTLIIDNASIELFADEGLSVMTEIFFSNQLNSEIEIQSDHNLKIQSLKVVRMKSVWK
jgi:fructan beta-fructosidase